MMMGNMMGMAWIGLLWLTGVLGFAYIIWVLATKENNTVKLLGQILAIVIAALAIIIFIYMSMSAGQMRKMGYEMDGTMMNSKMKREMMDRMMKDGKMPKEMREKMLKMMK